MKKYERNQKKGRDSLISEAFWGAFFGWTMPVILYVLFKLLKGVVRMSVEICEYCGAKFEGAKAKSSLRLHQMRSKKCKQKMGGCSHENTRLLNPNNELENTALQCGYSEICVDCEEVLE